MRPAAGFWQGWLQAPSEERASEEPEADQARSGTEPAAPGTVDFSSRLRAAGQRHVSIGELDAMMDEMGI